MCTYLPAFVCYTCMYVPVRRSIAAVPHWSPEPHVGPSDEPQPRTCNYFSPSCTRPTGTVAVGFMDERGGGPTKGLPASPAAGYSVCYSARIGSILPLVTLFTARQGLTLTIGDAMDERNRHRGTLVRPVELRADGVVWLVDVRAPRQTRVQRMRLLVMPTVSGLLPEPGINDSRHLWGEVMWVSRGGAGRGAEGMQLQRCALWETVWGLGAGGGRQGFE